MILRVGHPNFMHYWSDQNAELFDLYALIIQILGLNRSARLNGDIELWTSWHFDYEMKNAEGKLEKEKE